jgi:hypothetical protein
MENKKNKMNVKKYIRCNKCKKEIDHPRRGMCLNCYRKTTGLSKGKIEIKKGKTKLVIKKKLKIQPFKSSMLTKPILINPILEEKDKGSVKAEESLSKKWWRKYLASDFLERQNLITELPLVKELAKNGFPNLSTSDKYKNMSKEDLAIEQEKFNSHMLSTMILSYIEDLIQYKNL